MSNETPNGFFYLCIPDEGLKMVQTIAQFHNTSLVDAINMAIGAEFKRVQELRLRPKVVQEVVTQSKKVVVR